MTSRKVNGNNFGPSGGKGKGKFMEDSLDTRYREPTHSNKFPGAIKIKTHLFAVMRDNKTWCFA